MRYGIFSDVHGNLEALQAVLRACALSRVDALLCAGDTVGYGPDPVPCLKIISQFNVLTVAGNHDWAVAGKLDYGHFTAEGRYAIDWTRLQMSVTDMAYLNDLPLIVKNKDFILVHASLNEPERFKYIYNLSRAVEAFKLMDATICFIGHTHVPGVYVQSGDQHYLLNNSMIEIKDSLKYIVNVGSVGQPRDGNPMSSFCIYDATLGTIELRRTPYNFRETQAKIMAVGLPSKLASRLEEGS